MEIIVDTCTTPRLGLSTMPRQCRLPSGTENSNTRREEETSSSNLRDNSERNSNSNSRQESNNDETETTSGRSINNSNVVPANQASAIPTEDQQLSLFQATSMSFFRTSPEGNRLQEELSYPRPLQRGPHLETAINHGDANPATLRQHLQETLRQAIALVQGEEPGLAQTRTSADYVRTRNPRRQRDNDSNDDDVSSQ